MREGDLLKDAFSMPAVKETPHKGGVLGWRSKGLSGLR